MLRLMSVALLALTASPLPAQTIWDGGAAPDNSINNATNWNNDTVILDGSQAVSFAASGSLSNVATMNVPAKFKTITFNKANGFTIDGSSMLAVSNSTASGSPNITVSSGQNAGQTVISAPFAVETGATATKLLNILNNSGLGIVFSNTVSASVSANPFGFRLQGAGLSRFVGAITNCTAIQPALAAYSGTNIFAGNQTLATNGVIVCDVQIASPGTGSSSATARIQMGESASDIQTWRSTLVQQIGTLAINSTATTLGGVSIETGTTAGTHGGILEVNGSLVATTLGIGSSSFAGTLKLAGPAYFSGAVSIGTAGGNSILGNAASPSALTLSSGTISSDVTIGGGGANDNNLTLIKTNSGTLTLGGTHTYTGATLVQAGRLDLTGTISSSVTVSNGASLGGEGSTTGSVTFSPGTENFYFDPTTGGALTANTINAIGATVIVNASSSASGVVMQSSTTPNGITGIVGVNFLSGARGNLSLNGAADTLSFTPTSAATLTWNGGASNSTFWDVITTTNWNNGTERFYSSDSVRFDDSASSFTVAVQGVSITPGSTVFSNNVNTYTLSGGSITGTGPVTKSGSGTVNIISGGHNFTGGLTVNAGTLNLWSPVANNFTGGVTNNGGTLVISNMNQIAATTTTAPNSINLNGGTLSYTGPTFSQSTETLVLNLLGGVSAVEITGTNSETLRVGTAVTGAGDLIKSGAGTLAFGRNNFNGTLGNIFTGKILVTGGQLDIRQSDSLGSTTGISEFTNATLYLDPFGQTAGVTFDPETLVFGGYSFIRNNNQSPSVSQVNVIQGPITNNGTLGIYSGTSGGFAELQITSPEITNTAGAIIKFGNSTTNFAVFSTTPKQIITVSSVISGPASVTTEGGTNCVYTLSAANTYTGNTTLNGGRLALTGSGSIANSPVITVNANGVLDVSGVSFTLGNSQVLKGNGSVNGDVTANGTIVPGASVGTLTFSNNLTINGNLVVELDKSLAQSNDVINVLGTLNNTGTGTLTVSNVGPGLVAGDKFTLFNQFVPNGQNLIIVPPAGVAFTNQLADDGSITVLTAPALTPPTLSFTNLGGGNLQFTWSGGGTLQAQTNSLSIGLGTNWVDYPGSSPVTVPISPANGSVFFRVKQ
jgi:fibronectin-binding autotransporter adhesin